MPRLSNKLKNIIKSGHTPAVSYAQIEPNPDGNGLTISSAEAGQQNIEHDSIVNQNTQFPASSLSKIVFSYLVLKLAEEGKIDLDVPLASYLRYDRFVVDGKYQEKAWKLTARHVLSHSADLSNFGPDSKGPVKFNNNYDLGKGYSYSGEAILYLQKAIEKRMGADLETLARQYVFEPLSMDRTTFDPTTRNDENYVSVHTELGKAENIYVGEPIVNAAGSLLTTGNDFSKLMLAWISQKNSPILGQAFALSENNKCGLGWHICPNEDNEDELIAYQFGENPNTRAFVAINLATDRGAAFFTNSENGMSIANQIFSSSGLAKVGQLQNTYHTLSYTQSDKPGWQETLSGKIAESDNNIPAARAFYERALAKAPNDRASKQRLIWFNKVRNFDSTRQYDIPLKDYQAGFYNQWGDKMDLIINDRQLLLQSFGQQIPLVRISETEFLPEKDQFFKISLSNQNLVISYAHGGQDKILLKDLSLETNNTSSYGAMARILGHQALTDEPVLLAELNHDSPEHANSQPNHYEDEEKAQYRP